MSDFTFRVDYENLEMIDAYAGLLERFPTLMSQFVNMLAEQHESNLLSIVQVTPGTPVEPWPWVSRRQQIAFYLTDGFGKGIPHQRGGTNSLEESWEVYVTVLDDTTTEIAVQNNAVNTDGLPYGGFVMGWDSQPGFVETGWLQIPDLFELIRDEKESMFEDFVRLADDALTNWREAD